MSLINLHIQPVDFPLETPLTTNVRCQDCRHFSSIPASGHQGKLCASLGIEDIARPCDKFLPGVKNIKLPKSAKLRTELFKWIASQPSTTLSALSAVINQAAQVRRAKFKMGQEVYFLGFGDDYLSNWRKGYVLAARKDEYLLVVGTPITKFFFMKDVKQPAANPFSVCIQPGNVLNAVEFYTHSVGLRQQGRLTDPRLQEYFKVRLKKSDKDLSKDLIYQPPTIDDRVKYDSKLFVEPKKARRSKSKALDVEVQVNDD